jgi:CO/xanthine dehydrogenase Mo-binding subunit
LINPMDDKLKVVSHSFPRIDALSKVRGQALFPGDINLPDQCYLKVLFSNRPHAIVHQVDTALAQLIPGVLDVLTASDVPVNEYGLIINDQPVLCGPGSNRPYADHVRFVGDQIAVTIAESEEIAAQACAAVEVSYEDLPVIPDVHSATAVDAYILHPDRGSNIITSYRIRKGDVSAAFQAASVIVEGEYQTPAQEHAYLQPEAGLAFVDKDEIINVVVAGQWTHEDQEQIAHALNMPNDKIRVVYPAIGGAFGGREDMSVQIILALAAWKLYQKGINRPVKIIWSREESIIGHHKRHPYFFKTRWGATNTGHVIAAEVEIIADGGAYAYTSSKVLGNATLMCTGPYQIPNVSVDASVVYTNNIPNGAFRGFGGPQGAFEAECQINRLAEKLGLDPVEIRRRNLIKEGEDLSVGTPLPKGVSIGKVVEKCADEAGWKPEDPGHGIHINYKQNRSSYRWGRGFACAFKNVGFSFGAPEECTARIELFGKTQIEKAVLYHAGAEVGQGVHTVMVQMAAEALDLSFERIQLVASDTARTPNSGSVSASRMTFMSGNAILGACALALDKWKAEERPAVAEFTYRPPRTTPFDPQTGKSEPNFAYGYVAECVDVRVDTETGQVEILNVVCANDVGKAINPQLVVGQVQGAIVQAAGYALLENFIQRRAIPLTKTFSTYLIPTVLDIPENIDSHILEYADPIGPWGARGMGEMPFLPLAAAVVAAVHAATGVWFYEFPLTPERVLRGLGKLE